MFKLLRRISGSFTGRLDRDWNDDATSSAPQIGRKRRMSEEDDDIVGSLSKRSRSMSEAIPEEPQREDREESPASPVTPAVVTESPRETEEVREVTKGVKEVELEDEDKDADADSNASSSAETPEPSGEETKPKDESEDVVAAAVAKRESKASATGSSEGEPSSDSTPLLNGTASHEGSKPISVSEDVDAVAEPSQSTSKEPEVPASTDQAAGKEKVRDEPSAAPEPPSVEESVEAPAKAQ